MTVVGFNFLKINVEKSNVVKGKINISNNVAIKEVEETDLSLGSNKQKGLRFDFEFTSKYEPEIGSILLAGNVLFIEDEKKVKEITKSWKKEKKVPKEVMTQVLNSILTKSNIEALLLSRDVNLPPPIPMPKVNTKNEESEYIG